MARIVRRWLAPNLRLALPIAAAGALALVTIGGQHVGLAHVASPTGELNASQQAIREGHKGYADRSPDVRTIIQRMYANESRYHSLVGLFADRAPGDKSNSVRIELRQPDYVRVASYANDSGSGSPEEFVEVAGGRVSFYSPAADVQASGLVLPGQPSPPPVDQVPLGTVEVSSWKTPIEDTSGTAAVLANMYTHPTMLVTSPFFTDKSIVAEGDSALNSRRVWVMRGRQVPGAPLDGVLGNGWRMYVDQKTGIVLRVEYLMNNSLIGWAGFARVEIDPAAVVRDPASAGPPSLSVPVTARHVDIRAYMRLARS